MGQTVGAGPIDYLELTREGLRSVMAKSLAHTIEHGLFDEQHFFITYLTTHKGVVMPQWLKAQFPEQITIVLQHEFRDLAIMDDRFTVGLSFSGKPAMLVVPFAAVKTFMDPSVNFQIDIPMPDPEPGFEIDAAPEASGGTTSADIETMPERAEADDTETPAGTPSEAEVVSLDAFRKK